MNNQNKVPEKYRPALLALMKEWQKRVMETTLGTSQGRTHEGEGERPKGWQASASVPFRSVQE
jgi:hypothetical protein